MQGVRQTGSLTQDVSENGQAQPRDDHYQDQQQYRLDDGQLKKCFGNLLIDE
jgi:hypothetical protein